MTFRSKLIAAIAFAGMSLAQSVLAECVIPESVKKLDPIEVGFCESDAVFVGKVEQRLETIRAFRPEGSDKTSHFKVEHSTVKVGSTFKGALPESVKMIADLYVPDAAYSFQLTTEYLIFAKKLTEENEYSGASAKCSLQPTLPIKDAKRVLARLEDHKSGKKAIDCAAIRTK